MWTRSRHWNGQYLTNLPHTSLSLRIYADLFLFAIVHLRSIDIYWRHCCLAVGSHTSKRENSVFAIQFVLIQLSSIGRSSVTNRSNRNKIGINIYRIRQMECLTFVKWTVKFFFFFKTLSPHYCRRGEMARHKTVVLMNDEWTSIKVMGDTMMLHVSQLMWVCVQNNV